MKIEIGNLNSEQSKEFLEFLEAGMRQRMFEIPSGSNTAYFDSDQNYHIEINDVLFQGTYHIRWAITLNSKGIIKSIEVDLADPKSKKRKWQVYAQQAISDILSSILTRKRKPILTRQYYSYIGATLDGEYWNNQMRFAPLLATEEKPYLIHDERIFVVDQIVQAIDSEHGRRLSKNISDRFIQKVCLLLDVSIEKNDDFAFYWTSDYSTETGKVQYKRVARGYNDLEKIVKLPKKGELCQLGKYSGTVYDTQLYAGRLLTLPKEFRKIMAGYKKATVEERLALDRCASLYYIGKVAGKKYPTVKLSYEIASAESIAHSLDAYNKSFSEFIRVNLDEPKKFDQLLKFLHGKVRSAHFHAGEFVFGDMDILTYDISDMQSSYLHNIENEAHQIIRKAIMNWILNTFTTKQ